MHEAIWEWVCGDGHWLAEGLGLGRSHMQMCHHGLQPLTLLGQLDLQLLDHLHLHAALGRAPVIQSMLCVEVFDKLAQVFTQGLTAGPLAFSMSIKRVGTGGLLMGGAVSPRCEHSGLSVG